MTKAELVAKIAEKNGTSKAQAEASMNAILDVIQGELAAGNKLTLTGFGTFSVSERKARTGRNPRTGKEIKIPACKVAQFKPGKVLKEAVK
ncbi:MAG: HU family DNA-binding protein [Pseudodesulfovibrio sp.]|uniref:Histone family protein DNA-binding protein n=1 Tax=Pseudodesulfovibrio aespoeensis (strain ATCC 700646 / DSM 10631 / Aspo-2) TaxID=643562 RepID=E6VT32_PSEA9|nr:MULTISPECIES: HU family DNA-binding protein [Pseudodesulfovibrio]MBU4191732.1 HU family DNA-binding protein [Pseudomonadota bacterium]ADU62082.1 histone family protein DNA-binding protein [Pseudodesulfovibrio aespoeensis Aspo-2]MBU4243752.1 HU family DNA-binding protein [Pseudomonadota bacterium]MBU4379521.1 HU family DNA-binding protein [Pseudomonadota bacterium]MBU4474725.1 HU family DNA-binding protein [Pseudomonadota bacterium]